LPPSSIGSTKSCQHRRLKRTLTQHPKILKPGTASASAFGDRPDAVDGFLMAADETERHETDQRQTMHQTSLGCERSMWWSSVVSGFPGSQPMGRSVGFL